MQIVTPFATLKRKGRFTMRKRTTRSLLEQKRLQYHATITHPAIRQEMNALSDVFKELIFYYGVLDVTTEDMVQHLITEGIPMLLRPMATVQGKEKKRYHRLVLRTLHRVKQRLAYQLLEKEARHQTLLQPVIDVLLHQKREA